MNHRTRDDLINLCRVLAQEDGLQLTVQESAKCAVYAGIGAFVGGMVGGPIGMAVGGTITSLGVANTSKPFKCLVTIINGMDDRKKEKLAEAVLRALQNVDIKATMKIADFVLSNDGLRAIVIKELINFFKDEIPMPFTS